MQWSEKRLVTRASDRRKDEVKQVQESDGF